MGLIRESGHPSTADRCVDTCDLITRPTFFILFFTAALTGPLRPLNGPFLKKKAPPLIDFFILFTEFSTGFSEIFLVSFWLSTR